MDIEGMAVRVASAPTDDVLRRLRELEASVEVSGSGSVAFFTGAGGERRDVTSEFPRAIGFWVRDRKTTPTHFNSENASELRSDFVSLQSSRNLVVEIGGRRYRPGDDGRWES